MGILDRLFSKKKVNESSLEAARVEQIEVQNTPSVPSKSIEVSSASSIKPEEKKFYQPDSYYSEKAHENTAFERSVITFEERKKTCIPSARGLYVAEILLLEYVSYGNYPNPSSCYPGLWWFEYGIRDVNAALSSLAQRGFISMGTASQALSKLTIPQLKEILSTHSLPVTGKKTDLEKRISENISDEMLISYGVQPKYVLTEIGIDELQENAYVPYMHKHHRKTTEDTTLSPSFNVWSINKLLGEGSKDNWKRIVDDQDIALHKWYLKRSTEALDEYKKNASPLPNIGDDSQILKSLEETVQIDRILLAEETYMIDQDFKKIISFWEDLWKNNGLITQAKWGCRLAELYLQNGDYEKARLHCKMILESRLSEAKDAEKLLSEIQKHFSE